MKKLPEFKSEEEEIKFWQSHPVTDYLNELEPGELRLSSMLKEKIKKRVEEKAKITMWLNKRYVEETKRIAAHKGVPYQTLLRLWIANSIRSEERLIAPR